MKQPQAISETAKHDKWNIHKLLIMLSSVKIGLWAAVSRITVRCFTYRFCLFHLSRAAATSEEWSSHKWEVNLPNTSETIRKLNRHRQHKLYVEQSQVSSREKCDSEAAQATTSDTRNNEQIIISEASTSS